MDDGRIFTQEEAREMREALLLTKRMIDEALPKFDWGKSPLDANAIRLLNEAPIAVNKVLNRIEVGTMAESILATTGASSVTFMRDPDLPADYDR